MRAIIGGTGFDHLAGLSFTAKRVETRWGGVDLYIGRGADEGLVFLPRHGASHQYAPHTIPYRANIAALGDLGVEQVVGIYAVGSITCRLSPGEIGIVEDFVDFSGRSSAHTFYDGLDSPVVHAPMDKPFDIALRSRALMHDPSLRDGLLYVSTNGPRLETKAEIALFKTMGMDIVGMTLASEVSLLNEAKIPTLALAYSINWAAGVKGEAMAFIGEEQRAALGEQIPYLCRAILSI
jgi:purine nucleoside phosphorylase